MRFRDAMAVAAILTVLSASGCGDQDVPTTGYFGRVETSGCTPTVCPISGQPAAEAKAWQTTHPCEPLPDELACRLRSLYDGEDWPDKVDATIEAASVESGGFSDLQKQALRCLAYMPGVIQFGIGRSLDRSPRHLTLNMPLKIQGGNRLAAQTYIDRFGPYLGQIWNLNSRYALKTSVSGDIIITTRADAYAGYPYGYGPSLTVNLDRVRVETTGEGCPDYYFNSNVTSEFNFGTGDTLLPAEGRLTPEQAVQRVLDQYPECSAMTDSENTLYFYYGSLSYQVTVACRSHCGDPGWPFTARVDAYTGSVTDLSEECCVDCWEGDAWTGTELDAREPDTDTTGDTDDTDAADEPDSAA